MPDNVACAAFDKETRDGRNMKHDSQLLSDTVSSIVDVKEQSDIDSFLSGNTCCF